MCTCVRLAGACVENHPGGAQQAAGACRSKRPSSSRRGHGGLISCVCRRQHGLSPRTSRAASLLPCPCQSSRHTIRRHRRMYPILSSIRLAEHRCTVRAVCMLIVLTLCMRRRWHAPRIRSATISIKSNPRHTHTHARTHARTYRHILFLSIGRPFYLQYCGFVPVSLLGGPAVCRSGLV